MKIYSLKEILEELKNPSERTLKRIHKAASISGRASAVGLAALGLMDYKRMTALSYSDILKLFDDEKVLAYHLDLSSRQLRYFLKGSDTVNTALIPDSKLFLSDIHEKIKKFNREHPESPVIANYSHGIPTWFFIAAIVTVIALYILNVYLFFTSQAVQQIQIGSDDPRKNFTRTGASEDTERKATFADVAGADEEKEELVEVVEYLKDPEKFTKLGARVPKGVLLVGPPGTGKTLLARAVAGEADVPFFSISGSEFVEMYVGVGAARVRDLFERAKKKAPAIIFIDEIDAMARRRGTNAFSGNEEREQTLNQLLVELDGFDTNSRVIVIAATNRADILDPALLRPGRFDRQVHVNYPDIKGRAEILKVHAKNMPLLDDVNLEDVAKTTTGFTGADLENLLNEAALLAAKNNRDGISSQDISDSAIKVVMGSEKRSKKVNEKERRLTAYHEAGHAITTFNLDTLDPVHEVSIIPRGAAGGYTMSMPQEDKSYMSKNEMLDELVSLLGGRAAEAQACGDISTGASNDIERATALARRMITKYGMSNSFGPISFEDNEDNAWANARNYSEDTASAIDKEINQLINDAYSRADKILKENRGKLDKLASYLLDNEKIDGEKFVKLMEQ